MSGVAGTLLDLGAVCEYCHLSRSLIPDVKGGSCTKLDLDKASKTQ